MRKLNLSKKREENEIQFLNDVLSKNASSANKTSRKSLALSPDFRRDPMIMGNGFNTSRARLNESTGGNYATILSEINNMIDVNSLRLSGS